MPLNITGNNSIGKSHTKITILMLLIICYSTFLFAITGDIDQSGRVDGNDLIIFSKSKNTEVDGPGYNLQADLNNDGTIDDKDLEILTAKYGLSGRDFSLWVADSNNNKVSKHSPETGVLLTEFKNLKTPVSISLNDQNGSLWLADSYNNRIVNISSTGNQIRIISGFNRPMCVSVNQNDFSIWVADTNNHRVVKLFPDIADGYNINTDSVKHIIIHGFSYPASVSVNQVDNSCWVADKSNNRLVKLDSDVTDSYNINESSFPKLHSISTGFNSPNCVSVNYIDGSCWVADMSNNQVVKIPASNTSELFRISGFKLPCSLTVNPVDGTCWVADTGNHRIVRLSHTGSIISITNNFKSPYAVSVNTWNGNCWAADTANNQVVKILLNGKEDFRISHFNSPQNVNLFAGKQLSGEPEVFADISPLSAEISEFIQYSATALDHDGNIIKYEWDFEGDGIFDWESDHPEIITHQYLSYGIYNPVLRVTDDSFLTSMYYKQIIRIGNFKAIANADKKIGIAPLEVNFTANFFEPDDGRVLGFEWDFDGDGQFDYQSTSSGNTTFIFQKEGSYIAALKIQDSDNIFAKDFVYIKVLSKPPEAEASADISSGKPPLTVNFSGSGSDDGTVLLYEWDFDGDGIYDWINTEGGNSTHVYQTSGKYNAAFRVTDNDNLKTTKHVEILVNRPPVVSLHANKFKGNALLLVNFTSDSQDADGQIVSYDWDFDGDGDYELSDNTTQSTMYSFVNPGLYKISLKVVDNDNFMSEDHVFIHVLTNGFPVSNASVNVNNGTIPLMCNFDGTALDKNGSIVQYEWFFGEASNSDDDISYVSSTTGQTSHTYNEPGIYTAVFIATDNDGNTDSESLTVTVEKGKPVAIASASIQKGLVPLTVDFQGNQSYDTNGDIVKYEWFFGEHADTDNLIASYLFNGNAADESTNNLNGTVYGAVNGIGRQQIENSALSFDGNDYIDLGNPSQLQLTHNQTIAMWIQPTDFSQRRNPYAKAYGGEGTITIEKNGQVNYFYGTCGGDCEPYQGFKMTDPLKAKEWVNLVLVRDLDNMQLYWYKNGILINSAKANFSNAKISSKNAYIGKGYTYNFIGLIDEFHIYDKALSENEVLQLYNNSRIYSAQPDWTSNLSGNTRHVYSKPGTFFTSLKITDNDGYTAQDFVLIKPQSIPLVSIHSPAMNNQLARDVIFNASANDNDGYIVLYEWDFETDGIIDHTSEHSANSFYSYGNIGTYTATLMVTDNDGYSNSTSVCFIVENLKPDIFSIVADPLQSNGPATIQLDAETHDKDGKIIKYEWDFDGDNIFDHVSKTSPQISHNYSIKNIYNTVLRITDNDNATAVQSITINIKSENAPQAIAEVQSNCVYTSQEIKLEGKASTGNIEFYEWDFDSDGIIDWMDNTAGEVISYSSQYNATSWAATNLIDGKLGSGYGWSSGSYPEYPQDIVFATPNYAAYTVDRICINPYTADSSNYWAKDIEILVSETGLKANNFKSIGVFQLKKMNMEQFFNFSPEKAKYIKLRCLSSQNSTKYVQMGEFKIFKSNSGDNLLAKDGTVYHQYDKQGIYQATLKVTNELGLADQSSVKVKIVPAGEQTPVLWIADYSNNMVKKLTADGDEIFSISGFNQPYDLDVNQTDGHCWVVDRYNNQIVKLAASTGDEITRISGFKKPHKISINQTDQSCWIADYENNQVVKLDSSGKELKRISGFYRPVSVSVNPSDGSCWVADYNNHQIAKLAANGDRLLTIYGFKYPRDLAVNSSDASCWVADRDNHQLIKLSPEIPDHYNISLSRVTSTKDSSINAQTGSLMGDAQIIKEGKSGYAAYFDGQGDYITVPYHSSYRPYTQITLECWFYPEKWNSSDVALLSTTHGGGWNFYKDDDLLKFLINIEQEYYNVNFPVSDISLNQWHHIGGTFDGHQIKLYLDGILKQTANVTGSIYYKYNNAMQFGAEASSGSGQEGSFFQGKIDEIRIWNDSFSQTEITNMMVVPLNGNENNLIGYWQFNDKIGKFHTSMKGFNQPVFVSVNPIDGTCLVSDYNNNQIVKISEDCQTELFRVSGFSNPYMLVVNPYNNTCWIPDHSHHAIVKLSSNGFETLRKTGFNYPTAIAIDFGNRTLNHPPTAQAGADCLSGTIPLTVNFTGSGIDSNGTIRFYEWDFDGNGIYDFSSQTSGNISYTYTKTGNYNAVLRVTDNDNLVAYNYLSIHAGFIKAIATVSSTRGDAVFTVNFEGYGKSAYGRIHFYEWDFDGDGIFDWNSSTNGIVNNHKYYIGGLYLATFRVTNTMNQSDTVVIPITVNRVVPVAVAEPKPASGESPLLVVLDGSKSYDADGSIVSYEWDYNGDGIFDYYSDQNPEAYFVYQLGGEHYPVLKITDNEGLVSINKSRVSVNHKKPTVSVITEPLSMKGNAPLTVSFSSELIDGEIALYEWNFGDYHIFEDNAETQISEWNDNFLWHRTQNTSHTGKYCWTDSPDGLYENKSNRSLQSITFDFTSAVSPNLTFWHKYDFETGFDFGYVEILNTGTWTKLKTFTGVQNEWEKVDIDLSEYAGLPQIQLRFHLISDDFFARDGWYIDDINISDTEFFSWESTQSPDTVHVYTKPGTYKATLKVTDSSHNISENSVEILVNPLGAPTAVAGASSVSGTSPLEIQFNADNSLDHDGKIVRYSWDFGDLILIESAGYKDGNLCSFYVQNNQVGTNSRGFNMVILDEDSFSTLDTKSFDTCGSSTAANDMADYIHSLPDGRIILVAVKDEASTRINENLYLSLESLGARFCRQIGYRDSYALIGIKGTNNHWASEKYSKQNDGKVILHGGVPTWHSTDKENVFHVYQNPGIYQARLFVTDDQGLTDYDTIQIQVGNPEVYPVAYPLKGQYPLTVKFFCQAFDEDGTIEYYNWDCNGDGVYEKSLRLPDPFEFTYSLPGIYHARLQIIDNDGMTDEKTITIHVTSGTYENAPVPIASAFPVSGKPMTIYFTGKATAINSTIKRFEWDFDGDGTVDWNSSVNGNTFHTYKNYGFYQAIFRVTNDQGIAANDSVRVNIKPEGSPDVSANIQNGAQPLDVLFNAQAFDMNGSILRYDWDFNGDGTFDWSSETNQEVSYHYDSPGHYNAVVKVSDDDGLVDFEWIDVVVDNDDLKAMRNKEAFDPGRGERIAISSVFSYHINSFTLKIIKPDGSHVKTIIDQKERSAGVYSDEWDGKNDDGNIVQSGLYYFVIDYKIQEKTYHFDLTNNANIDVLKITPVYSSVFNPVEDQFLTATFSLEKPAQISAYVSPFNGNALNRIKTLYLMAPKKSGSYVISWDGSKDDGTLAAFNQSYVIAIFAYALSDNAIIVESNPVISDISTDPDYFNPANPYHTVEAKIRYHLSNQADILVQISNENGSKMRTFTFNDVDSGNHIITWDGYTDSGILVDKGIYNVAIKALDRFGQESMPVNGIIKVFY
ncbi:surface layer protein [Candidatus Magnetomorum sp. HK-1]|nr:surface layer protein [Candidatus Magnetomorum sp. HK-1]